MRVRLAAFWLVIGLTLGPALPGGPEPVTGVQNSPGGVARSPGGIGRGGVDVDPIANRYLAFGDSITRGSVDMTPYPVRLEAILDLRVAHSEAINAGKSGEGTAGGRERIVGEVALHQPAYVLILEGTNDVTRGKTPAEVYENLDGMIDNARSAGVDGVQILLATLLPRRDALYDETDAVNQQAVWPVAEANNVPVCDLWTAFVSRPAWSRLFVDMVHPNDDGYQLMADTFYACLLASFPEIEEETTPPVTWIEPLPAWSECGQVGVSWNGVDDLSWVTDYDVQAQIEDGPWTDWVLATEEQWGTYTAGRYGERLGFRVRGRDFLGNQGDYAGQAHTLVGDSVAPYEAHVRPLPAVQLAPFKVSWWGADACADVVAFDVQYRAGLEGTWQDWLLATPDGQAECDPPLPEYGAVYYFRVRAQDAALNWGEWSDGAEAWTVLARYAVAGWALNVRHEPVAAATVSLDPEPLWLVPRPGGFGAYTAADGSLDISVARPGRYGPLPPMLDLPLEGNISGLEFVLPPLDDAVTDGGFEAGDLAAWQAGGSAAPEPSGLAHTGQGAARLGGGGGDSWLAQAVVPDPAASDLCLSLLVRTEETGVTGTLHIGLTEPGGGREPVTYTLAVDDAGWQHTWYDLAGLAGRPLTLTLTVSNSPAIVVDEVSVGSASTGGQWRYLPVIYRRR